IQRRAGAAEYEFIEELRSLGEMGRRLRPGGGTTLAQNSGDGRLLVRSKRRPPSAFALRASAGQAPSPAVALAQAGPRHSLRSRWEGNASAVLRAPRNSPSGIP